MEEGETFLNNSKSKIFGMNLLRKHCHHQENKLKKRWLPLIT
jgi:hypothetical protein